MRASASSEVTAGTYRGVEDDRARCGWTRVLEGESMGRAARRARRARDRGAAQLDRGPRAAARDAGPLDEVLRAGGGAAALPRRELPAVSRRAARIALAPRPLCVF